MRKKSIRHINAFVLKHRMLIFMVLSFCFLVTFPIVEMQDTVSIVIIELFFNSLLLAGVYLSTRNKKIVSVTALLILMAITMITFNYLLVSKWLLIIGLTFECIVLTIAVYAFIVHVLEYRRITEDKIYGAINAYLLVVILWALIYTILEIYNPNSFMFNHGIVLYDTLFSMHRMYFSQFLYYSFVTMSTLGYGDITPISGYARLFASLQCVFGQLYVATLIARMVGLQITHSHSHDRDHH